MPKKNPKRKPAGVNRAPVINLDLKPGEFNGWTVEAGDQLPNVVGGTFTFDPSKLGLFLSEGQKKGKWVKSGKVREALKDRKVFGAALLDWLIKPENQRHIPASWKGKTILFWGTIYRDADGGLYVRKLYEHDGRWYTDDDGSWLDDDLSSENPAVVLND